MLGLEFQRPFASSQRFRNLPRRSKDLGEVCAPSPSPSAFSSPAWVGFSLSGFWLALANLIQYPARGVPAFRTGRGGAWGISNFPSTPPRPLTPESESIHDQMLKNAEVPEMVLLSAFHLYPKSHPVRGFKLGAGTASGLRAAEVLFGTDWSSNKSASPGLGSMVWGMGLGASEYHPQCNGPP